jgi:hypothetical protein
MNKNGYLCLKQNGKKMCNELRKFLGILPNASIIKDSDGIISFSYNDLKFLFVSDNEDVNYIRLMLPNVADVKAIKTEKEYFDIINDYNNNYKAVKISVIDNSIWISIEQFVFSKDGVNDLFLRMITILSAVIKEFRDCCLK